MIILFTLLSLIFGLGLPKAYAAANIEKIELIEGAKINLTTQGKAWIEDGAIIKMERNQGRWELQGLKPGRSEFEIGDHHFLATVISRNQNRTLEVLAPTIAKALQLKVVKKNDHVFVVGRILRWQDWQNLAEACADEICDYEMRATASKEVEAHLKIELSKMFRKFSLFPYHLEITDRFQIHVHPKLPQFEKLASLVSRYGITLLKDATSIEMQPLVKVQIIVAEVKKDAFLNYGVQWPSSYSAQIVPGTAATESSGLAINLQALESSGLGKVLARPNLLCRSGKEAEFVAGGEFPIKIMNFKMQDVVWKRYGILLKIKPLADFSGRMSISLETEISSLDGHTVDGIPGLLTNRVQSHFDLSESKTIALSGLIKSESTESQAGLPGLSRIPILGSLFSSKEFRENRTELVIFVRPEIVQEGSDQGSETGSDI